MIALRDNTIKFNDLPRDKIYLPKDIMLSTTGNLMSLCLDYRHLYSKHNNWKKVGRHTNRDNIAFGNSKIRDY